MRNVAAPTKVEAASRRFEQRAMTTPSLVQCPTCHGRRDFVGVEPAVPKKEGNEIRTFACRPCDSEMRYLISRRGVTQLAS
jgi:hypothetical protein